MKILLSLLTVLIVTVALRNTNGAPVEVTDLSVLKNILGTEGDCERCPPPTTYCNSTPPEECPGDMLPEEYVGASQCNAMSYHSGCNAGEETFAACEPGGEEGCYNNENIAPCGSYTSGRCLFDYDVDGCHRADGADGVCNGPACDA